MCTLRAVLCVLTVLLLEGTAALRCKCTTSKGGAQCDGDYCDIHGKDGRRAACGAVRVKQQTHFACVLIRQSSNDTYCHVVKSATACWCRGRDFCNAELEAELFDVDPPEAKGSEDPDEEQQLKFDIISSDEFFAADTRVTQPKLQAATPMDAIEHIHLTAANKTVLPSLSPADFFDSYEDELEDDENIAGWDVVAISPSRNDNNVTAAGMKANKQNANLHSGPTDSQRKSNGTFALPTGRASTAGGTIPTTTADTPDNFLKKAALPAKPQTTAYQKAIAEPTRSTSAIRYTTYTTTTTARTTARRPLGSPTLTAFDKLNLFNWRTPAATTTPTTTSTIVTTAATKTLTTTESTATTAISAARIETSTPGADVLRTPTASVLPRTLFRLLPPAPTTPALPPPRLSTETATTTAYSATSQSKSLTPSTASTTKTTVIQPTEPYSVTLRTTRVRASSKRASLARVSTTPPTIATQIPTLPSVRHLASPTVIYPQSVPKTALDKAGERDNQAQSSSALPKPSLFFVSTVLLYLFHIMGFFRC